MNGRRLLLWLALVSSLAGCVPAHHLPENFQQRIVLFGRIVRKPIQNMYPYPPAGPARDTADRVVQGRRLRWLLPRSSRMVLVPTCRHSFRVRQTQWHWRHQGRAALFDRRGRRLTPYAFYQLESVMAGLLSYDTLRPAGLERAVLASGFHYLSAVRPYGASALLTSRGHRLGTGDYLRLVRIGPNAVWAVRALRGRLCYGVLDSLAREIIPFDSVSLSLPDEAGLLRRSSAPARGRTYEYNKFVGNINPFGMPRRQGANYPDTATVSYYRPDGRRAFPGRFTAADAFWQGRALVKIGQQYGVIDTAGCLVVPLAADQAALRLNHPLAEWNRADAADPLSLFSPLVSGW